MAGKFQYRPDRQTGPMLASTLVIALGALGSAVVITAGGQSPVVGALIFLGIVVAIPVALYALKAAPQGTLSILSGLIGTKKTKPQAEYQLKAKRSGQHYGTNRPPSVEEMKEAKNGLNNWTPSQAAPHPRKPQ